MFLFWLQLKRGYVVIVIRGKWDKRKFKCKGEPELGWGFKKDSDKNLFVSKIAMIIADQRKWKIEWQIILLNSWNYQN